MSVFVPKFGHMREYAGMPCAVLHTPKLVYRHLKILSRLQTVTDKDSRLLHARWILVIRNKDSRVAICEITGYNLQ